MTGAEATIISSSIAAGTGIATALGVLALTQHGERIRVRATAEDRQADRQEAIRARLHADRLDAYRRFTVAYSAFETADQEQTTAWAQRQLRADELKGAKSQPDRNEAIKTFDAAQAWWSARAREGHEANVHLIDSLSLLELVASEPVAAAARSVLEAARLAGIAERQLFSRIADAPPDMWSGVEVAKSKVSAARDNLRDAIRRELRLDT